jgi:muramidase (phage lysozyme)
MTPAALSGAAILLDFIGRVETGRTGTDAYRTIFGHKESTLSKPVTEFTLDELLAAQTRWGKNWGSSAAGKYQIIRKTLAGLVKSLGLSGSTKFGAKTQDMLGLQLLKGRGYEKFATGRMSLDAFALELAKEWASMPVLADTKGASRTVKAGQSYYAGDGLNKSLVTPAELRAVLQQVREAIAVPEEAPAEIPVEDYEQDIAPGPAPASRPGWLALVVIGILAALVAASVFFGGQAVTGEEVSLFGPPEPRDRPFGFVGAGGNLWADIGMQIALSFLMPLVSAAATAAVGWIVWQWNRLLKADFDAKSAAALHAALERGMMAAIEAFGPRTSKTKLIASAADYAETFNGGTIKRFGLTRENLEQLALPHLASAKKRT